MRALLLLALLPPLAVPSSSTVEARPQEVAERALDRALETILPAPAGGAVVIYDLRADAFVGVASAPGPARAGVALPAGSVMKPFIAHALMEARVVDAQRRVPCPARMRLAGAPLRNHLDEDLPPMPIDEAIARSCNTVFYALASEAWRARRFTVVEALRAYGFGRATGTVAGEDAGFIPHVTSEREALSLAIGQAALLVTPAQVALAFGALTTGGTLAPRALDGTRAPTIEAGRAPDPIARGLRGTTTYGTAAAVFSGVRARVAAKTGTAQAGVRPTAWFAAYAPADAPRYVMVVALEDAGLAADVAAPVGREVIEGLLGLPSSRERFVDARLALILVLLVGGAAVRVLVALRRRARP